MGSFGLIVLNDSIFVHQEFGITMGFYLGKDTSYCMHSVLKGNNETPYYEKFC